MTIAEKIYEKLKTAPPALAREVLDYLEFLEAKMKAPQDKPAPSWDDFAGTLKDADAFKGDPVEIQRQLRDEWHQ